MRKIFYFFLPIFLLAFLVTTKRTLLAQEPPQSVPKLTFDQVYSDYIESLDKYNKAHSDYVLKKSQYQKFQSLKSRQDAYDATLLMLQERDNVVISYLQVLRIRLDQGIGVPDSKKEALFFRIDEETDWYTNHRDNLKTSGSSEDLVADSNLATSRWGGIDPLAYEIMSVLSQGKIADFTERVDKLFFETKEKLEIIRNEKREEYTFSNSKFEILDRWVFEAEGKITRSKEKANDAEVLLSDMILKRKNFPASYNTIVSKLGESQLYLKEADLFIKEIIRQIKTEE